MRSFGPLGQDVQDGPEGHIFRVRTPAERPGPNRQQMRLCQPNFHGQRAGILRKRFVYND